MDAIQRGIIQLLKSAITGQAEALPEGFCLEDARELIDKHRIKAPIYEGAVRCGIDKETPVMKWLLRSSYQQAIRSEKQMQTVERIFAAFETAGIAYMPVKGCNMKLLYPKPSLRIMGDVDILIHTEDYPRIRQLMLELGLDEGQENYHVYPWRADGLLIELHKSLIPVTDADYYAYYGDGWRFARPGQGSRHDLNPEDTYIFLIAHFARHYRFSGIGCRHVLDLYVYRRSFPDLDETYIRQELEKLNLLTFCLNVERTLAVWFADSQGDEITELITQFVFSSGNWGSLESYAIHELVKETQEKGHASNSRFKSLLQAAFPARVLIAERYPVLKKWPVLLPIVWVIRIVQTLLFRKEIVRRRKKMLQAVSDENVEIARKSLEAVGLTYDPDAAAE